jgi:hypothetical protein
MRSKTLGLMLLSLLLTVLPACTTSTSVLTEDDQAAIYAAVVRQLYTVDHTFGDESPNFPIVYLQATDATGMFDPNDPQPESHLPSEQVQSAVVTALDDLPAEFIWIENLDEVPLDSDTGGVEGNGAIITLGRNDLQEDGSVHIVASLYFASLGGTGMTYIVEQINGIWKITGYTGERWIS